MSPAWARNGRELFFMKGYPVREMMVVDISYEPTFGAGTPRRLFQGPMSNGTRSRYYKELFRHRGPGLSSGSSRHIVSTRLDIVDESAEKEEWQRDRLLM